MGCASTHNRAAVWPTTCTTKPFCSVVPKDEQSSHLPDIKQGGHRHDTDSSTNAAGSHTMRAPQSGGPVSDVPSGDSVVSGVPVDDFDLPGLLDWKSCTEEGIEAVRVPNQPYPPDFRMTKRHTKQLNKFMDWVEANPGFMKEIVSLRRDPIS